jgi:hypothetical protein
MNMKLEKQILNCEKRALKRTLAGAVLMAGSIVGGFVAYDNTNLTAKELIPATVIGIGAGMYLWGSGYCRRETEYLKRRNNYEDFKDDLKTERRAYDELRKTNEK